MHCNLNVWDWVNGAFPPWFMADVVAFHQLEIQVGQHSQDASISLSKRKK